MISSAGQRRLNSKPLRMILLHKYENKPIGMILLQKYPGGRGGDLMLNFKFLWALRGLRAQTLTLFGGRWENPRSAGSGFRSPVDSTGVPTPDRTGTGKDAGLKAPALR